MLHPEFASINADFLPKPYEERELPESLSSLEGGAAAPLLQAVMGCSPYLAKLLEDYPDTALTLLQQGADAAFSSLPTKFDTENEAALMRDMRHYKHRAALIIALADISGAWKLQQVTQALSTVARNTLQASLDYLITQYQRQHGLILTQPQKGSGIFVLAMGKLGADELNYSSDVDLVLLYESDRLAVENDKPLPRLLNRMAQDYVRLMQERTGDGYVFRMDLRLRPDPASTPLMVSTGAAMRYYESVGQNWERAAFIKARAIAGDIAAGEAFLTELKPFIWRKSLDFAAIADIQSIKRQMDREFKNLKIEIAGFDVKRGLGGIREIEFLAQIHQLIWGGRKPELRSRATLETYTTLQKLNLLTEQEVATLARNYDYFRNIEHRLQMLRDAQTHAIPESEEERDRLACFCGYENRAVMEQEIAARALETHQIYHECFNENESLAAGEGKLVFTGVSHDAETLNTLRQMGFNEPEVICDTIQAWHRGSISAMRSGRARELLTELTPPLLKHIAEQPERDAAFRRFEQFFSRLPAGVTLLSLLYNNPQLLRIFINIIGNAPQLAEYLSQHPDWLDALLSLSHAEAALNKDTVNPTAHYRQISHQPEEAASWLCRYRAEHEFVMGCQVLAGSLNPLAAMPVLTHIADTAIAELSRNVMNTFEVQYGRIDGGAFIIVALGRLGSQELTFGSDLDLLFLYDAPEGAESDGKRPLGASTYYNRLAQRLIGQLTAMTPEGRLYEVDDRLRPAGKDGPLAVSLAALEKYYKESAWTFERMALLRERVVFASTDAATDKVQTLLRQILQTPLPAEVIRADALDMRARVWKEFPSHNPWEVKHARGGLLDIAFLYQSLVLTHAPQHPQLIGLPPIEAINRLAAIKALSTKQAQTLIASLSFQQQLQSVLRLCHQQPQAETFSHGLQQILTTTVGLNDFNEVGQYLHRWQESGYKLFITILGDYDHGTDTKEG